jgi:hypothetical protein
MEFDWNNPPFELEGSLNQREIEESFEDPFAIRLLPDSPRPALPAVRPGRAVFLPAENGSDAGNVTKSSSSSSS